ncbi:MAG TPA: hypothetical protein PKD24_03520 [Pyrinomonadaceae bacterium]|nr:hypothetical protein [Pyrinomonadaceae bacterium]
MLISVAISIRSDGIEEGLRIGEADLNEFKGMIGYENQIQFSGAVKGTYEHLRDEYRAISLLFGVLAVGAILLRIKREQIRFEYKTHWWGLLLIGVSVVFALSSLRKSIRDKQSLEVYFWEGPRNAFLHTTLYFDWILVSIIGAIVVSEITRFIISRQNRDQCEDRREGF